jgi:hypothetical protein
MRSLDRRVIDLAADDQLVLLQVDEQVLLGHPGHVQEEVEAVLALEDVVAGR